MYLIIEVFLKLSKENLLKGKKSFFLVYLEMFLSETKILQKLLHNSICVFQPLKRPESFGMINLSF